MCQSPVKILNPKLSWSPTDPKYLVVQCGRCFECRARKQQEWFVRSYYEFIHNKKGSNFFFTLTYNNENVPIFSDKRCFQYVYRNGKKETINKVVDFRFKCFSSDDITKFLKLFRQNLHRKYPDKDVSGIKYLITSEFGEKYNRSHYHGEMFVPFFLPVQEFKDLICKSWRHGFVGASKKGGFLIKSISALEYTVKYSTKDMYFYDKVMCDYLDKDSLPLAEFEYRYNLVKDKLPRLRVSSNFGASLVQELKDSPDLFDKLLADRPLVLPSKNGKLRFFSIPRYVIQKLCRHVDKYFSKCLGRPYFVLTDIGRAFNILSMQDKIKTDILDIRSLCSPQKLNMLSSKSSFDKPFFEHVQKSLSEYVQSLDLNKISFYKNVLRYFPVDTFGKHSADWYFRRQSLVLVKFFETSFPQELWTMIFHYQGSQLRKYNVDLDVPLGRPLKDFSDSYKTLSQLGEFQNYERFCKILDDYNKWVCSYRCKERRLKRERIDSVCSSLADFVLYDNYGLLRKVV